MPRAIIETYGCTLNRADSDIMQAILADSGMEVSAGRYDGRSNYDYVIINTCTVKTPTEQRILDRIGKVSKNSCRLIVTGCMASANPDRILAIAPNARIVTTDNVHRIAEALDDGYRSMGSMSARSRIDKLEYFRHGGSVISRVPISEGCLSSCGFCETKFARGPLNSFSEKLILKAIRISADRGSKEIELTSQDVGAYGLDRGTNIGELICSIADIPGDFRVRIGMLNPEHLHRYIDTLIEGYKNRRIYRFIHLPLQSASNRVLRGMGRRYTIEQFNEHVRELRARIPGISIETDMIVGYPSEGEADFLESMNFISESRPAFTNVSRFGARPHAEASRLKQLENSVVKERSSGMSRLARSVQMEDLSRLIGSVEDVLVTEENERSLVGRDDYYRIVALNRNDCNAQIGDRVSARIYGNTSVCLLGAAL